MWNICRHIILIFVLVPNVHCFYCKWSNEGCSEESECCSNVCEQRHPGTNPRCTKCGIGRHCLYNYHCENRLICGPHNTCCADYWETCAKKEDCCNPEHKCISAPGFIYRKCLYRTPRMNNYSDKIQTTFAFTVLFTFLIYICQE